MTDETYHLICSSEPMRGILVRLWNPKVGDEYWDNWNNWEGIWLASDAFSKQHVDGLTWLPRSDDLMEMLKDEQFDIYHTPPFHSRFPKRYVVSKSVSEFWSSDCFKQSLFLAFAWTQGLKWDDGKWRER